MHTELIGFFLNVTFCFVLFCLLFICSRNEPSNLHTWAIASYGIAGVVAGVAGFLHAQFKIDVHIPTVSAAIREAWSQGRWALGGVTVTWIQSQGYIYCLGMFAGPGSVGEANAARLLLSPLQLVATSIQQVLMPRLAKLRVEGQKENVFRIARIMLIGLTVITIIYVVCLTFLQEWITAQLFTADYNNISILLFVWALVVFFQMLRSNSAMLLQVHKKFRCITISNTFTAIIMLFFSLILIPKYEAIGGVVSLAVGELALALILWGGLINVRRQDRY
jgi:O-antigen/teichoic acid export membrane protein